MNTDLGAVVKHNAIVDPGGHGGQNLMVAVMYSFEVATTWYGVCSELPAGKHVDPTEFAMNQWMAKLALERKLVRLKSYRELQGLSNTLLRSTAAKFHRNLVRFA